MTAALLVVSYGSHDLVEEGLTRTAVPDGTHVVVVDNFTSTAERQVMRSLAGRHGWILLEPDENLGFGGGMNLAANEAIARGATSLVLLNPDAYLEGDGVAALDALTRAHPEAIVSPLVVRPDGSHFASLMEIDLDTGTLRRVRDGQRFARSELWVSGACVAMSAELWQRVDGFDEDYFLYWEDVDLSVRITKAGGAVHVAEHVRAVHSPGGTQEQDGRPGKSPTYYFYNVRNRLVFAAKHPELAAAARWRRSAVPAAYGILLRGGRRQFLHPARTFWPALRGTISGLRFRPARATAAQEGRQR
ncbi:MAG: glycosyltransferase family 2 protein [Microbacterium sp.]|nr:MAG: glycosyltransferase family 2 protein [Microbacterium sp.]